MHPHACAPDGVFVPTGDGPPAFLRARPITQADLATLFRLQHRPADACRGATGRPILSIRGRPPRYRRRHISPPPQARPARAITQMEGSGMGVMITEKISGDAVLSSRELVLGTLETIPPKM